MKQKPHKLSDFFSKNPRSFQKWVLAWFDQHGRKTLPWQENKTPYRVYVSEIMLQQTQVTTVIPYYLRFMNQFPTVESLAAASEDEVLHLWTGLGYYTRARNLHRTATLIVDTYGGTFPDTVERLIELPGIGRSTAGAICAIAFQQHATILDGNVKRVLTRFCGIQEWPGEKKTLEQLWKIAEHLTPTKRIADYTQAMMDIGATLCTRGKPACERCPLQKACVAHEQNNAASLPRAKPKKTLPIRHATFLLLQHATTVLLEKRPKQGIWGGLWSVPELSGTPTLTEIKTFCRTRFGLQITQVIRNNTFRHTFSHFHLEIAPVVITLKKNVIKNFDATKQIWYNLHEPEAVGLPAPVKFLLER